MDTANTVHVSTSNRSINPRTCASAEAQPRPSARRSQYDHIPVYLNIYRLNDGCIRAYHSGVEVGKREYAFFEGAGIYHHRPRNGPVGEYKKSKLMGYISHWR